MEDNSKKIEAIQEAIRVIRAMEDKSSVYQNRMNVLFAELDQEEDSGAMDSLQDAFDEVIEYLEDAESAKQELLDMLDTYAEILKPDEDPQLEKPLNPHPLLKRSGKKF